MKVAATHNLLLLLESPQARDLSAFHSWRITTDDAHQDTVQPARGFDAKRLGNCLSKKEPWAMIWPQAVLRNSSLAIRLLLTAAWKLRSSP